MSQVTEVSVDIDATADEVYELVADLPAMGRWSPECHRCDWLDGASDAAPGVRFKGHNRIGWRRWSTTGTVVAADPGRELSFDVHSVLGLPVARWSYRFESRDGSGCTVTESTEDRRGSLLRTLGRVATGVSDRSEHNRGTMETTLRRIKETAEARDLTGRPVRAAERPGAPGGVRP